MRMRSDRARRERREVCVTSFRGLDLTSPPARALPSSGVDGENFTVRAGVLCKRRGWRQEYPTLPSRINGLFGVESARGRTLLCYAGTEFYLLVGGQWERVPVKNLAGGTSAGEGDRRIFGFSQGGYLYLVGVGLYLRYGCFDGVWEIRTVEPYVPTTTVGISPVAEGDTVRESGEFVNLLTPRRKNTLFGGASGSAWYLDAPVSPSEPLEILATVVRDGNLVERRFVNRPSEGGERLYDAEGQAAGSVETATGRITLGEETLSGGSYPSILVTFTAASGFFGETDNVGRQTVRASRIGVLFGVGGARDRLFLAGSERSPNTLLFSAAGDYSYFPDVNAVTVGSDAERIRALLPMEDGTLAVFHAPAGSDAGAVHYLSGHTVSGSGGTSIPVFEAGAGAACECPVNAHAVAELAGERLLLSGHGVFGVELLRNLSSDVRRAAERGYGIRAPLEAADLSESVLYARAGRLWLSVGDGTTFVTDEGTLAREATGGSSYAWWRFSGTPARVFASFGEELLLGTPDGRILCESEDDCDRISDRTQEGELGFDFLRGLFVYGGTLDGVIKNGRRIRFESEGIYTALLLGDARIEGTRVYVGPNEPLDFYSTGPVYVKSAGEGVLQEGKEYYLVEPDAATRSFSLSDRPSGEPLELAGVAGSLCLYFPLSGRELCICDVNGTARTFAVALDTSSSRLSPVSTFLSDGEGEEILPLDPVATVTDVQRVHAYWELPPMDFSSPTARKTLLSLSLSGCGEITAEAGSLHAVRAHGMHTGELDGGDGLDLLRVTLSSEESESVRVLPRLRCVGNLHVRLSSAWGACEIHGVRAVARIENEIKGVNG